MMRYSVRHITTLEYEQAVRMAQFAVRLKPRDWPRQIVPDYTLKLDPAPPQITEQIGGYYINEARFVLPAETKKVQIESRFTVDVEPLPPSTKEVVGPVLRDLRELAMCRPDLSVLGPASYIFASPIAQPETRIDAWSGSLIDESMAIMAAGYALMNAIHEEFTYATGATRADTPPIEAFNKRHGVCQDFSHIMIIAARAHGIPAAYVSGYLRTLPPPGKARLVGADAMHAWVNLWCGEELGWVGFDPTNNCLADSDHIFIGMGRDYSDVAPLDGRFRGSAEQKLFTSVDVAPLI